MSKKKRQQIKKSSSWLVKIFRFFFPKNFGLELRKGMEFGQQPGQTIGNAMFRIGKEARKVIDPRHKLRLRGERDRRSG